MQRKDVVIVARPESKIHLTMGRPGRDVADMAWPLLLEDTMIGKDVVDGLPVAKPLPDDVAYLAFRIA